MLVKSQCSGNRVTGLYVGENNVRRYFPKNIKAINLQLDHLQIQCGLAARFWDGEPEIHDPRLCLWIEAKQSKDSNCRASMPLSMMPAGDETFVLGFALPHAPAKKRTAKADSPNLKYALAGAGAGAAA